MNEPSSPPSVFRISLTNASLLSALYFTLAVAVELARRFAGPRWAERASLAFEVFPARMLDFLGLLGPLRAQWQQGVLSDGEVRLLYGATTILLIYLLGVVVGAGMWLVVRRAAARREPGDEEPR